MLEGILEGQMAPQYFPVQTLKNMGASIDIVAIAEGKAFEVERCQVRARRTRTAARARWRSASRTAARASCTPATPATARAARPPNRSSCTAARTC